MKKRLLFILCLFFVWTDSSAAQTKSVTNRDLEKFRQKRLQTEREYRENYSRLGFPSPEELEKQNVESRRKVLTPALTRFLCEIGSNFRRFIFIRD